MNSQQNYVVEKNVPQPARKTSAGVSKYPFDKMDVGDSFLFVGPITRIRSATAISGRRHGRRYSVRAEGNVARVWRVA